jgi:hypothetical protein
MIESIHQILFILFAVEEFFTKDNILFRYYPAPDLLYYYYIYNKSTTITLIIYIIYLFFCNEDRFLVPIPKVKPLSTTVFSAVIYSLNREDNRNGDLTFSSLFPISVANNPYWLPILPFLPNLGSQ